jgi:hypothetical protein
MELAMSRWRQEAFARNVQAINENFRLKREELIESFKRDDEEAALRVTTTLRVGGTGANKATNTGQCFFDGEVRGLRVRVVCVRACPFEPPDKSIS